MRQHYTQEQANAILRCAVERMPMKDEMSRDQLVSIAAELGLSAQDLSKAEADWEMLELDKKDRAAFAASKRVGFYQHLTAYVLVNILVALIPIQNHNPASVMPAVALALLWGVGIICHGLAVFNVHSDHYHSGYARWRIARRANELAARELSRIPSRDGS